MSQPDKKTAGKRPKKTTRRRQNKKTPKSRKSSNPPGNNTVPSPSNTQIINPTTVKPNEIKDLVPVDQKETEIITDPFNPTEYSIFSLDEFPYHTRPIKVKPKQLLQFLEDYECTPKTLDDFAKEKKVDSSSVWRLINRSNEIRERYKQAFARKSHQWGEKALKCVTELPSEPELYQSDRETGEQVLSNPGSKIQEMRHRGYLRMAEIGETGSFVPLSRQEVQSRNLHIGININKTVSEDFNLDSSSPDDLLDVIKKSKKVDA